MKFVDLFCGGGFGARGAVEAGGKPILAVDSWELATKTYQDNFPGTRVICSPIEKLKPTDLAKIYKPDVLLTSPECTSHSIARGSKPGSEKSRETAISIIPWLEAMMPKWLIVENVKRMQKWDRHDELVSDIESYGYTVSDLFLNASEFGTPQSRRRLFLVGSIEGKQIQKEELLQLSSNQPANANSVLAEPRTYPSAPLYKPGRAKSTIERAERAIDQLGRGCPFIIVYYSSDYAGGWQKLDAPLRTVTTVDRFGLVTWFDNVPYLRMLQPSELVRAMGACPTKQLLNHGTRRDKVKLCGNGVCSPIIEVIFRRIAEFINNGDGMDASLLTGSMGKQHELS